MKKIKFLCIIALLSCFSACSEEDLGGSSIVVPELDLANMSQTDSYIYSNFTEPFNVEVIYRWNDNESNPSKNLVPPDEDNVVPFLKAVKKMWIDTYVAETSEAFLKEFIPKQIQLVGSPSYNTDGSITQGTADAGRKVTLFEVNDFSGTGNSTLIRRYAKTLFHEFTHILHQKIEFSTEFQLITPAYTSSWYLEANETAARKQGFISRYAMSAPEEDFAEMVALMLINDQATWDNMLAEGGTAMEELLRKKEKIVKSYMLNTWGIDLAKFQVRTTNAINEVINGNLN